MYWYLGLFFQTMKKAKKFELGMLFSQDDVQVREAKVNELHDAAEPDLDLGFFVVKAIVNELRRMVDVLVGECLLNNKLLILCLDDLERLLTAPSK